MNLHSPEIGNQGQRPEMEVPQETPDAVVDEMLKRYRRGIGNLSWKDRPERDPESTEEVWN